MFFNVSANGWPVVNLFHGHFHTLGACMSLDCGAFPMAFLISSTVKSSIIWSACIKRLVASFDQKLFAKCVLK